MCSLSSVDIGILLGILSSCGENCIITTVRAASNRFRCAQFTTNLLWFSWELKLCRKKFFYPKWSCESVVTRVHEAVLREAYGRVGPGKRWSLKIPTINPEYPMCSISAKCTSLNCSNMPIFSRCEVNGLYGPVVDKCWVVLFMGK